MTEPEISTKVNPEIAKEFKKIEGAKIFNALIIGSDRIKKFMFDVSSEALTNANPEFVLKSATEKGWRGYYVDAFTSDKGAGRTQSNEDIKVYLSNAGIPLLPPIADSWSLAKADRYYSRHSAGIILLDNRHQSMTHIENFEKGINQAPAELQYAQYKFLHKEAHSHGIRFKFNSDPKQKNDSNQNKFVIEPEIYDGKQEKTDDKEFTLFSERLAKTYKILGKSNLLAIDHAKKEIVLDPEGLEKGGYVKFEDAYTKMVQEEVLAKLKKATGCEWTAKDGRAVCDHPLDDAQKLAIETIVDKVEKTKKGNEAEAALYYAQPTFQTIDQGLNSVSFSIAGMSSARWQGYVEKGQAEFKQTLVGPKPSEAPKKQEKPDKETGMKNDNLGNNNTTALVPDDLRRDLMQALNVPADKARIGTTVPFKTADQNPKKIVL